MFSFRPSKPNFACHHVPLQLRFGAQKSCFFQNDDTMLSHKERFNYFDVSPIFSDNYDARG